MSTPDYGRLGEQRVGAAAGAWGLPDFVYQPIEIAKGGARREVGDRLIWVGKPGRDPAATKRRDS